MSFFSYKYSSTKPQCVRNETKERNAPRHYDNNGNDSSNHPYAPSPLSTGLSITPGIPNQPTGPIADVEKKARRRGRRRVELVILPKLSRRTRAAHGEVATAHGCVVRTPTAGGLLARCAAVVGRRRTEAGEQAGDGGCIDELAAVGGVDDVVRGAGGVVGWTGDDGCHDLWWRR